MSERVHGEQIIDGDVIPCERRKIDLHAARAKQIDSISALFAD